MPTQFAKRLLAERSYGPTAPSTQGYQDGIAGTYHNGYNVPWFADEYDYGYAQGEAAAHDVMRGVRAGTDGDTLMHHYENNL